MIFAGAAVLATSAAVAAGYVVAAYCAGGLIIAVGIMQFVVLSPRDSNQQKREGQS